MLTGCDRAIVFFYIWCLNTSGKVLLSGKVLKESELERSGRTDACYIFTFVKAEMGMLYHVL